MSRSEFHTAWALFQQINVSVPDVDIITGRKVDTNIASGTFQNACPTRMSYVLTHSGFPVNKNLVRLDRNGNLQVSSGADDFLYIFRTIAMREYLQTVFGSPDVKVENPLIAIALMWQRCADREPMFTETPHATASIANG